MTNITQVSPFTRPGCGDALFSSIPALLEYGAEARAQQAAIFGARAALVAGQDPDDVAFELALDLAAAGMDADTIREHVSNPQKDLSCLFIACTDLT